MSDTAPAGNFRSGVSQAAYRAAAPPLGNARHRRTFVEDAVRRIWQNVISIPYRVRSDVDLVELARRGNVQAYDELVTRYQGRVYGLVLGMLGSEEDATVALRDTFVAAYRSLEQVDAREPLRTWLYRHAVRAALARVRATAGVSWGPSRPR